MERFKVVLRGYNGTPFYGEVDGEECFRLYGQRFFLHQYIRGDKREWRVSCVLSGGAVGWGVFPEDAIRMARKKLYDNRYKYFTKLRNRPRRMWKMPLPKAIESNEIA